MPRTNTPAPVLVSVPVPFTCCSIVKVFAALLMLKVPVVNEARGWLVVLVSVVPVTSSVPPLNVSVPPFAPMLASEETLSEPPLRITPPVKVLVPLSTSVPAPVMVSDPLPPRFWLTLKVLLLETMSNPPLNVE